MSADDLVVFLRARLDEDEQTARAATPGPWWDSPVLAASGRHTIRGGPREWRGFDGSLDGDTRPVARIEPAPDAYGVYVTNHDADATHIARFDPPRELREVVAKRRRLERHRPIKDPLDVDGNLAADVCEHCAELWPCPDVCDDASVYVDHPDFYPAWRVG